MRHHHACKEKYKNFYKTSKLQFSNASDFQSVKVEVLFTIFFYWSTMCLSLLLIICQDYLLQSSQTKLKTFLATEQKLGTLSKK